MNLQNIWFPKNTSDRSSKTPPRMQRRFRIAGRNEWKIPERWNRVVLRFFAHLTQHRVSREASRRVFPPARPCAREASNPLYVGLTRATADALPYMRELSCASFRHSPIFHAKVILDGAACRLGELGDVHDVLGVLGDDHVVPIVLRVLVSWWKEE